MVGRRLFNVVEITFLRREPSMAQVPNKRKIFIVSLNVLRPSALQKCCQRPLLLFVAPFENQIWRPRTKKVGRDQNCCLRRRLCFWSCHRHRVQKIYCFTFLQIDQLLQFYRPRCKKSQTKTSGRIAAMEFPVLWLKILGTLAMQLVSISPSTSQVGKFIILSWQRNPGEVNESFLPRPSLARNEKKSWLQPFVVLPNFFKIEINCRIVHA